MSEQARAIEALNESLRVLHQSLEGISEADAACKPDPRSWSALDCVEHLVVAERALLARIIAVKPTDGLPEDGMRGARATHAVINRSVRVEAPERAHPNGRFASLAEALERFDAARCDTVQFALNSDEDLARRAVPHPRFGILTGSEMLLVMAGHTCRHAEQIRELRVHTGAAETVGSSNVFPGGASIGAIAD